VTVFSLYVHIPYCQRRCPYCDFNAYGAPSWPEEQYTVTLLQELRAYAAGPPWCGQEVATIFFGGGTPSLFAPDAIARVLAGVGTCFPVAPDAEVTLEANPGTVGFDTLQAFRAAGVNRVSFGVQSLHDRHLATLGRIHDVADARAAVCLAREAGFESVNADLLFGIPGQSVAEWAADVRAALVLDPGHISAYSLTYEEGTAFHAERVAGRLVPVTEDDEAQMLTVGRALLIHARYEQYEISNYARPGQACRHNLTYWRRQPYLGIGAGAHSFAATPLYGRRWANARSPESYMQLIARQGHAVVVEEHPTQRQAIAEFLFLGLRLTEGVACDSFIDLFGNAPEVTCPALGELVEAGLLEACENRLRLTARGVLHADSVFATLI
jgi:oxygen-independent coproporphyrinogen-3 oxidase